MTTVAWVLFALVVIEAIFSAVVVKAFQTAVEERQMWYTKTDVQDLWIDGEIADDE